MALLELTRGLVTQVDDELHEFLSQWKWTASSKLDAHSYVYRRVRNVGTIFLHTQVLERVLGRSLVKGEEADHIDRDRLNNRAGNLRLATRSLNKANQAPLNGRRWKGVFKRSPRKPSGEHERPWFAQIMVGYRSIYLGSFRSEREAAYVYNEAALKHFGEFAYLNQVFSNEC